MKINPVKLLQILGVFAFLTCLNGGTLEAKVKIHSIQSPDGKMELQVVTQTNISFCLLKAGQVLVSSPALSLTLENGTILGPNARL